MLLSNPKILVQRSPVVPITSFTLISLFAAWDPRSSCLVPPNLGQNVSLLRFNALTSFKRMRSYFIKCSMRVCLMFPHNHTQILYFLIQTAWECFCALASGSQQVWIFTPHFELRSQTGTVAPAPVFVFPSTTRGAERLTSGTLLCTQSCLLRSAFQKCQPHHWENKLTNQRSTSVPFWPL